MALFLRTTRATIALSPLAVDSYLRVCPIRWTMFLARSFFKSAAIEQQLAIVQNDPIPDDFAQKTLSRLQLAREHFHCPSAWFKGTRRELTPRRARVFKRAEGATPDRRCRYPLVSVRCR